jgi:hypothetical protein
LQQIRLFFNKHRQLVAANLVTGSGIGFAFLMIGGLAQLYVER